ncbi:hypothetical protein SKAU_G00097270 [Synaphobranchus kaupii]|uniref:Uncharacterized protein n=1 Tax=Synaphobranchus kaupii TaxID=118154 RepID=A0A9Q1FXJ7_SYNKA|nr:hypothetical protein SKAU_G00097270 [Synaphobranchus kaupii]
MYRLGRLLVELALGKLPTSESVSSDQQNKKGQSTIRKTYPSDVPQLNKDTLNKQCKQAGEAARSPRATNRGGLNQR